MTHREKWATELAKQLEKLPSQVRAFAQNTESLACLGEGDANAGGVPADPLAGGLFAAEEREEAAPEAEAVLLLGGRAGAAKRPREEENLFGQPAKKPKV